MKIRGLQNFWKWLWNSESIWSYVVFLVLVFIIVKFIFLPGLGLVFGTSLPLAIVESSSMEHYALKSCLQENYEGFSIGPISIAYKKCFKYTEPTDYEICGEKFSSFRSLNTEEYWETCGNWYEARNITKEQFSKFPFKNGFRKGDLMVVFGKDVNKIKIGDVIIFNAGRGTPIIHRVISLNPLQTKGDHNNGQLIGNLHGTDETNINNQQLMGVAIAKIPYLGYVKIWGIILLVWIVKNILGVIAIILIIYVLIKAYRKYP